MPDVSLQDPGGALKTDRQAGMREAGRRLPPFLANPNPNVVLAAYSATTFLSALLLFSVQPMFAKLVLPRLGGAPSVWSVAMVFFQGALLAGYGYAHLLSRTLSPGRAAFVHFILLAGAAFTLPTPV